MGKNGLPSTLATEHGEDVKGERAQDVKGEEDVKRTKN